ncbi:MAG: hypothetical protein V4629_12630 [Pseudomonadota bacterium]
MVSSLNPKEILNGAVDKVQGIVAFGIKAETNEFSTTQAIVIVHDVVGVTNVPNAIHIITQ